MPTTPPAPPPGPTPVDQATPTTAIRDRTPGGDDHVDVLVVGGGAAGLSAALVLGRSRRSVLVVDDGSPRNAPAAGVHNFLTRDGTPPGDLLAAGRDEVAGYGVRHRAARAESATRDGRGFVVRLDDDTTVHARRLVVTTGLVDELPDVPGLAERWGTDVLHCPYCHGWEVRDRRIGVLATSAAAVHQALLFSQLSDDVVVLAHTAPPADEQAATLAAAGVVVVTGEVTRVVTADDAITGVTLADGTEVALDAVVVAPTFRVRGDLLADLGVAFAYHASGMGQHVPSDHAGTTDVPGVFVAGNVTDPMAQVVSAAAQGTMTGAFVNADLVMEDVDHAQKDAA